MTEAQLATIPEEKKKEWMEEIYNFLGQYDDYKIDSQEKYNFLSEILKEVKTRYNQLEKKRVERTKPLLDLKKIIDADFKQLTDPLVAFEDKAKKIMIGWLREEQARKDIEQKKIDAAALEQAKKTNKAEVVVPVVNTPIKTVRSGLAMTTLKDKWEYTVVDEKLVPADYLSPDPVKIKAAIANGARNIPGLKIENVGSLAAR